MASVELINLTKHYGAVEVIHGVSLAIEDGQFIALVGPSGCGKSTLLRMIAGLEEVTGGEVAIGGEIVNDLTPKERNIAMVFQSYALYPHMTVAENMGFNLKLSGVSKPETRARVAEAARMLDLEDLLDRKPAQLSGGQRQRVAMGRAVVRNPAVFLFDEPLSNLDAKLRVQMRSEIKALHQKVGTTSIYVTHDQIEAMTLADRVVVMSKGVIQQVGTPTDIYDHPANTFVASFIGSPAMNLVEGTIANGVFEAAGARVTGLPAHLSGPITLGFRAEDATIVPAGGEIAAPIYSIELLGEASMIAYRIGDALVSVKAPKEYRADIGATVHAAVPPAICHLFENGSGKRVWAGNSK
jgi:multiple sugar transport system ATP-binding protein